MRIDAHHHLWEIARGDYGWLTPDLAPIYRDFTVADLAPILAGHGVQATILVQAAPTEAETRYLLAAAARHSVVAGVVGWTDFAAADAPQAIARLAADPLLVGLRPMVQDIPDDDWLLRPDLVPGFEALARHDLVFDALVLPKHLPRLLALARRHPDLPVVIDHLAKPPIRERRFEPWARDLAALAARPNVVAKLSGLVTEASVDWTVDDLKPTVDHALACFSPERLLWGSDWPVVDLAGGYDRWRPASDALLAGLTDDERAAIFGGNAARLYLSKRGRKPC
jgi:L-fucono-1,5-lactonase